MEIVRKNGSKARPAGLALLLLMLAAPAAASPVQVMECLTLRTDGAIPAELVDLRFTIRRHIEQVPPSEVLENDFWAQGIFRDNGYFDITTYPIEGNALTDRSATTQTTVVDGKTNIGDSYLDEALSMNKSFFLEGWTLDSANILVKAADGETIDDHTAVPEVIDFAEWDPYACAPFCPLECSVTWDAPGEGVECCIGQSCSGQGICDRGSYIGRVTAVSFEDHEADHGAGFAINAGLNDAWVTAQAPFQGLFVTVYEALGLVFVAWFTFDLEQAPAQTTTQSALSAAAEFGGEDQRWVTAVGSYTGNRAELNMELTTGGVFNADDPLPTQDTDYGTMVLEFDDCEAGTVTFDVPDAALAGTFPIGRVVDSNVDLCEALTAN